MDCYYVTFAGHRQIDDFFTVEKRLDEVVFQLLREKKFVEFYVGNEGDFDCMAICAIRRAQKRYGNANSAINLVLPYHKANLDLLEAQFDTILFPECLHKLHPKRAITQRNQFMIDQCNLLICHVKKEKGGSVAALRYAKEKGKIEILEI